MLWDWDKGTQGIPEVKIEGDNSLHEQGSWGIKNEEKEESSWEENVSVFSNVVILDR